MGNLKVSFSSQDRAVSALNLMPSMPWVIDWWVINVSMFNPLTGFFPRRMLGNCLHSPPHSRTERWRRNWADVWCGFGRMTEFKTALTAHANINSTILLNSMTLTSPLNPNRPFTKSGLRPVWRSISRAGTHIPVSNLSIMYGERWYINSNVDMCPVWVVKKQLFVVNLFVVNPSTAVLI